MTVNDIPLFDIILTHIKTRQTKLECLTCSKSLQGSGQFSLLYVTNNKKKQKEIKQKT